MLHSSFGRTRVYNHFSRRCIRQFARHPHVRAYRTLTNRRASHVDKAMAAAHLALWLYR
jgi:hypothetical protein